MKKLRFEDLPETLEVVLEQLENIGATLKNINEKVKKEDNNRLMTRYEEADYFKVSITTIHHWTKKGKLKSYGIGGRVYYKEVEIIKTLVPLL